MAEIDDLHSPHPEGPIPEAGDYLRCENCESEDELHQSPWEIPLDGRRIPSGPLQFFIAYYDLSVICRCGSYDITRIPAPA